MPRLPFTLDQVGKLLSAATSEEWRGAILLGAFTGVRLLDVTNLKAKNLDLERKVINFTPRKTSRKGTVVEIPMHPELVAYFKKHKPSPFAATSLFPSLCDQTSGGREGLSTQFKDIMDAAEVDRLLIPKSEDGAARNTGQYSFHSLRHTFTSWLAKANVTEELRMKMTGHTESRTHQKYTHQELSTLQDALDKIPGLG